ncbi:MAG: fibronectin type III domain-containing protein, partial [Gemmatimonadota bacterium]|nr:fibronectin type III domain-containing protein [Gemmatimonadota bacterium]
MVRLVPRAGGAALVASLLVAGCNPENPAAPDMRTGQAEAPQPQAVQAVPDEYIVLFNSDVSDPPGLARQLSAAHGFEVQQDYVHAVKGFAGRIPAQALDGLRNNPRIASITPNFTYTLNTPPAAAVTVPVNGLRVRLVANDLAPGDVAAWPNQGSEADAVQANPAQRPVYHAPSAEFGGNASVGFNEGSDNDEILEIAGVAPHASGTLIAVFRQEDATRHNYGLFATYGSSSSRSGMVTRRSTGKKGFDYWDSTNGWAGGATVVSANQTYVGVWRIESGVAVDLQLDGVAVGSKSLGAGFPTFDRYLIGLSNPGTNSRFDGRVAEILFYDRAILDCERDDIVAGLGAEYGVSVAVSGGGCQPPQPPAPPTALSATATGATTMDLGWTDGSNNEDGFRIERRLGQAGAWSEIDTTGPNATSYGDSGLTAETEYCYQVRAYNADGTSAYTNTACATTDTGPTIPPPVSVPGAGLRVRLVANDLAPG